MISLSDFNNIMSRGTDYKDRWISLTSRFKALVRSFVPEHFLKWTDLLFESWKRRVKRRLTQGTHRNVRGQRWGQSTEDALFNGRHLKMLAKKKKHVMCFPSRWSAIDGSGGIYRSAGREDVRRTTVNNASAAGNHRGQKRAARGDTEEGGDRPVIRSHRRRQRHFPVEAVWLQTLW